MKFSTLFCCCGFLVFSSGCRLFGGGDASVAQTACNVRAAPTLRAARASIPLYTGPSLNIKGWVGQTSRAGEAIRLYRASDNIASSNAGDLIWVKVGSGSTMVDQVGYVAARDVACFESAAIGLGMRTAGDSCERVMTNLKNTADGITQFCGETGNTVYMAQNTVNLTNKLLPDASTTPVDVVLAGIGTACKVSEVAEAFAGAIRANCSAESLRLAHEAGKVPDHLRTCEDVGRYFEDTAAKVKNGCGSAGFGAAVTTFGGVWGISNLVMKGGSVTPIGIVFAAYGSTCKVAAATRAYVDWARASCSEQKAAEFYYEVSAELCTKMNDVVTGTNRPLPTWCPRRSQGLVYCGMRGRALANDRAVACQAFLGGAPTTLAWKDEFAAKPAGRLQAARDARLWRETSVVSDAFPDEAPQKCYIPDDDVICSR